MLSTQPISSTALIPAADAAADADRSATLGETVPAAPGTGDTDPHYRTVGQFLRSNSAALRPP